MRSSSRTEAEMARINGMLIRAAITVAIGAAVLLPLIA